MLNKFTKCFFFLDTKLFKHINIHFLVTLLNYHKHIYDNAIQGMYS